MPLEEADPRFVRRIEPIASPFLIFIGTKRLRTLSICQKLASRTIALTSQFENIIGFFQEFLLKNVLLRVYYLGLDSSVSRVLIKSEIIIATGMVWPVSSDKWKAP